MTSDQFARDPASAQSTPSARDAPSGASETTLVRRAQAGDAGAFEALYRAHAGRIHGLMLRLSGSGNQMRAEELTQDVFVRVWERLPSFRGESALGSWLHRMAVNVFLEQERGDRRRVARVGGSGDDDDLAADAPARRESPDERIDLERALALLPPGARTVFVLHDIEGYTHGEIAALTHTAPGTSRAHLFRARQLLMERLDQ